MLAGWLTAIVVVSMPRPAVAQVSREQALSALRSAATAGDVDAQLALANLLDQGQAERDDEALRWYGQAARSGNRIARRRYMDMLAKPPGKTNVSAAGFMVHLPRDAMQGDLTEAPADLPPGYHCHFLGHGQMWCHGGVDASQ
jgi:TPR repeat protein